MMDGELTSQGVLHEDRFMCKSEGGQQNKTSQLSQYTQALNAAAFT
jgi:hypothetical protein